MSARIFVGGLPFTIDDTQLADLFAPFGAIESARVIADRDTGRSRGFGFVEMTDHSEAETAIQALNGSEVGGRSLTVNEARPREQRGGGERGGERGGFGRGGGGGESWGRDRPPGGGGKGRGRDTRRDRW